MVSNSASFDKATLLKLHSHLDSQTKTPAYSDCHPVYRQCFIDLKKAIEDIRDNRIPTKASAAEPSPLASEVTDAEAVAYFKQVLHNVWEIAKNPVEVPMPPRSISRFHTEGVRC